MSIQYTTSIASDTIKTKKGEHVTLVTFLKKGWRDKKVFTVNLAGADSSFTWFICVFGSRRESFSFDLHVNHTAPRTTSRVYARGVLQDHAKIQCSGWSTIGPRAGGADTYVAFHTLLLSRDAYARTIPSLEIATPDVRAGHAASVDRFVPADRFYLETRGIDESDARKLLTQSFLSADLHHLTDTASRDRIGKMIVTHTMSVT
jgi:Fe-S cluster assembly protein SufD